MRADLYTAPLFFLLGAAMLWGGWTMDRLTIRQIHPASIPGLVPMMLGAMLIVCAVVLFVQARGKLARGEADIDADATNASWRHFFIALGICCFYALALVGHVPFPVATALFITGFVILFEIEPKQGAAHIGKVLLIAAILGIAASAAISVLFRYAFLVRLP